MAAFIDRRIGSAGLLLRAGPCSRAGKGRFPGFWFESAIGVLSRSYRSYSMECPPLTFQERCSRASSERRRRSRVLMLWGLVTMP